MRQNRESGFGRERAREGERERGVGGDMIYVSDCLDPTSLLSHNTDTVRVRGIVLLKVQEKTQKIVQQDNKLS
jgi:hypothetical protein